MFGLWISYQGNNHLFSHWSSVFELWEDADFGIAEVEDAKERLEALETS